MACSVSYSGTLYDEFLSGTLEDVWEISKTDKANYEIKDGELILSTEATEGNIYLWYGEAIPPGEPITIEARINPGTSDNIGDGMVGFLNKKEDAGNLNNDGMNGIKKGGTYFWVDVSLQEMRIRREIAGNSHNQVTHNGFGEDNYYVFKIELTADEVAMWLDDWEVQSGDRIDANFTERAFHVTPDGATDLHGPSTWTIDYIRLTGPTIPDADYSAVEPSGKAATTWGNIKVSY
jgi:hypothetical protein